MRAPPRRGHTEEAACEPNSKNRVRGKDMNENRRAVWDAVDCALLLIDYQDSVLAQVFEQDRRLIEFNASNLAKLSFRFGIPVVLSTIGVEMGVREPTILALA